MNILSVEIEYVDCSLYRNKQYVHTVKFIERTVNILYLIVCLLAAIMTDMAIWCKLNDIATILVWNMANESFVKLKSRIDNMAYGQFDGVA